LGSSRIPQDPGDSAAPGPLFFLRTKVKSREATKLIKVRDRPEKPTKESDIFDRQAEAPVKIAQEKPLPVCKGEETWIGKK
jgi:hypothetical protein